jgi:hypothetical protein
VNTGEQRSSAISGRASFKTTEEVQTFLAERPDDEVEIVIG